MASVGHLSEEEKEAMNEQQIHKVGIPPRQNLFKEFSSTLKETLFADDPLRPFKDQPGSRKFLLGIQTLFPIFEWGRSYNLNKFKGDLIAGLTIASLCIPQVERNIIVIPVQGSRFIQGKDVIVQCYAATSADCFQVVGQLKKMMKTRAKMGGGLNGNSGAGSGRVDYGEEWEIEARQNAWLRRGIPIPTGTRLLLRRPFELGLSTVPYTMRSATAPRSLLVGTAFDVIIFWLLGGLLALECDRRTTVESNLRNGSTRPSEKVATPLDEKASITPPEAPQKENKDHHQLPYRKEKWTLVRTLLGCNHQPIEDATGKCKKMKPAGTPGRLHKRRPSSSLSSSSRSLRAPNPLNEPKSASSSSSSFNSLSIHSSRSSSSYSGGSGGSFRGMTGLKRLSGCYECRMVVDPVAVGLSREPSLRSTICVCPECGEIFMKPEIMELHLSLRHAVSELGSEDTSKNIVEIIFQSSWLKKQGPAPAIDRVLKVHNTPKTISMFEDYRDSIKSKTSKKNPRCSADGNELLRFHSTTLSCALGLNGSTNLCNSGPCAVCEIIRNGFKLKNREYGQEEPGILTTATSGIAHDKAEGRANSREKKMQRAMLVCRVIAGRVKRNTSTFEVQGMEDQYDSVSGGSENSGGLLSSLDELFVFNPRAILPCFVVIYHGF
ncbi:hypothetical protein SAY86_022200 [Trapa natans]|uniref:C2H2-type domain-containing protein n=1 Tax=Trapa natans TaxID=22666 RepID=A0AAN7N0E1_TRANT|nr:hypothetical protein SAY86_022200 [Trapa natans]